MVSNIRFSSLFFFFLSFHHHTISQSDHNHLHTYCNQTSNSLNQSSLYQTNRETLLSSLRNRSSLATYSNVTTGLSPNTVHGMFLCRGDITKTSCFNCVNNATLEIVKECKFQKEAFIFYEECMIRYSDYSFSNLLEGPYVIKYSLTYFPSLTSFQEKLSRKIEELIPIVSSNSSSSHYLKDKEGVRQYDGSYTLDSMLQCSPDLDSTNCSLCLRLAFHELTQCCSRSRWAHIFLPKCLFRYNTTALPLNGAGFIKGNGIFGRFFSVVMTVWVLAVVSL